MTSHDPDYNNEVDAAGVIGWRAKKINIAGR